MALFNYGHDLSAEIKMTNHLKGAYAEKLKSR